MKAWLGALAGLVTLSACSVGTVDDLSAAGPKNDCTSDSDCGPGGLCVENVCRAADGDFQTLLLEVVAPSTAAEHAGLRFFKNVENLSAEGGHLDLILGAIPEVSGKVIGESSIVNDGECDPGLSELKITFTPTERLLGLSAVSYTSSRAGFLNGDYSLRVPPGEYDIYVHAAEGSQQNSAPTVLPPCGVVPHLYRRQTVPEVSMVPLDFELSEPQKLTVVVPKTALNSASLEGYIVEIVDPDSGRVLSAPASLTTPPAPTGSSGLEFKVDVLYSNVLGVSNYDAGQQFVRLRPPEGVVGATLALERSALELFTAGQAVIDQVKSLPSSVQVGIQVEADGMPGVPATISLAATSLDADGLSGLGSGFASFSTTVTADAEGRAVVDLLPGTYRVRAVPPADSGLAASPPDTTLQVAPASSGGFQGGKLISLTSLAKLTGKVVGPKGKPVANAAITAVPSSPKLGVTPLDVVLGMQPFAPRAADATANAEGGFVLSTDLGYFDVSVRPPSSSGFAWFVRPNLNVESDQSFGEVKLPLPVAYGGFVQNYAGDADNLKLPGSLIRAYVYMGANGYKADRNDPKNPPVAVVQIAETRAADDGSFQLLLPAHLN